MNLAIVGSRCHRALVQPWRLVHAAPQGTTIVSGRGPGVDVVAEIAARQRGFNCIIHAAEWRPDCAYNSRAGLERNALIERDSDECDAYPDGDARGTGHTIGLFGKAGKPIRVHEPDEASLLLFTAQIWYAKARLPHAFDVTRGSGGPAGDPFAPSLALLDVALPWLKREPEAAWGWYAPRFWGEMNMSRRANPDAWAAMLNPTAPKSQVHVFCCYCPPSIERRCHRYLLVDHAKKFGARIGRAVHDGGEVPRFNATPAARARDAMEAERS